MFHVGVVENRYDPLKLGRCQVRIVGLHTDDKNSLPTKDLPWSYPVQPVTSAAMSGIGHAPVGPVEGTWVLVVFRDKDCQMPLMLGTIGGIPHNEGTDVTPESLLVGANDQLSFIDNVQSGILGQLLGLLTGGNTAAKAATIVAPPPDPTVNPSGATVSTLGKTSEKYESGGKGPGTINDYNGKASGDFGGAQYGTYQFASYLPAIMKNGTPRTKEPNSPVMQFVKSCRYSSLFAGLTPATEAFDAKWRELAQKYPVDFANEQHEFVKKKYYDQACTKLKSIGFDHTKFGAGCQDMIWSTAVQYGPGKVVSIWQRTLNGIYTISEVDLITKIQDNKKANVVSVDFKSSSSSIQNGILARCDGEKAALLALAGSSAAATTAQSLVKSDTPISTESAKTFSTATQNKSTIENAATGFKDPNKKYPLYEKEQDTSRLARNSNIKDTIIQKRDDNRVLGVDAANNQATWDEPVSPYAAAYPFNHVYQSESGHVMEFDDTEGAERVHTYHKAGTYTEIDRNGRQVNRIVGDGYQIIDRNGFIFVAGNCNITVGGNCNIYAQSDLNIQADGDTVINSNNDVTWNVAGSMDVSVAEGFRLHAKSIKMESDSTVDLYTASNINFMCDGSLTAYTQGSTKFTTEGNLDLLSATNAKLTAVGTLDIYGKGNTKFGTDGTLDIRGTGYTKITSDNTCHIFGKTSLVSGESVDVKSTGGTLRLLSSGVLGLDGSAVRMMQGAANGAVTASQATVAEAAGRVVPKRYDDAGNQTNASADPPGTFDNPKTQLGNKQSRSNPGYPNFPELSTSSRSLQIDQAFEVEGEMTDEVKKKMIASGYATAKDFTTTPAEIAKDTTTKSISGTGIAPDSKTIDSMQEFPDTFRLSPNFTVAHFTTRAVASPTKLRSVFNQTEQELVKNMQGVALNILEPLIKEFPTMQITSAFRDYNTTGSKISQHCRGQAVDLQFKVPNGDYYELAKKIRDLLPVYDQLLLEYKSTGTKLPWIHISYSNSSNRGQVMTFFNHTKHSDGFTKLV